MKPIGVFYATREGQTGRIAGYIGKGLHKRGFAIDVANLAERPAISLNDYSAVILAASVHAGHHEPEMIRFIKRHRPTLDDLPNAFVSVTLSQAGLQRTNLTEQECARFTSDVDKMIESFSKETGWTPKRVVPVAGALLYRKYNFLVRFIMKRIARKAGGDTDTSKNYEYTDWTALDRFVDEFAATLERDTLAA